MSLRNLTKHYRVTMDSSNSNSIILHKNDGNTLVFSPSDNGLYRLSLSQVEDVSNMWALVSTVQDRAKLYTRRDVQAAQRARTMQNIIMHPGDQQMASSAIRYLKNCPVTDQHVRLANDLFGPNLGSLKGKTVHRPSPHVEAGIDPVPPAILTRHRDVTLAVDIMFVNKIPFLVTT